MQDEGEDDRQGRPTPSRTTVPYVSRAARNGTRDTTARSTDKRSVDVYAVARSISHRSLSDFKTKRRT